MTPEGQLEVLNSLTTDPRRIATRIRQAALLEAAQVPDRAVDVIVKTSTTGRLTLEDILVLRDNGIDIDGMVTAIQRADHTQRTTQDHTTTPRNAQDSNRVAQGGEGESRPAERRTRKRYQPSNTHWKIRRVKRRNNYWFVDSPPGWCTPTTCTCTTRPTWQAAIDHVNNELRNHALVAIETQEATNQPQEDQ